MSTRTPRSAELPGASTPSALTPAWSGWPASWAPVRASRAVESVAVASATAGRAVTRSTLIASVVVEVTSTGTVAWPAAVDPLEHLAATRLAGGADVVEAQRGRAAGCGRERVPRADAEPLGAELKASDGCSRLRCRA